MFKRIAAIAIILLALTGCVSPEAGLKNFSDNIDGYQFLYPNGWVAVNVSGGADVVYRDLIEETENVSVVVSPVSGDRNLTDLGDPTAVAKGVLEAVIAPPKSGIEASLVSAASREDGDKTYYKLDYKVELPIGNRHNLASVVVRRGKLFTLNISAPEDRWGQVEPLFQQVVDSFSVN
ncbi:MAG: photosystem II reaction center PsbP [Thermosynechococcaceae cyanobacterium]